VGGVPNIWADEWEHESNEEWAADRAARMPRGEKIGATFTGACGSELETPARDACQ